MKNIILLVVSTLYILETVVLFSGFILGFMVLFSLSEYMQEGVSFAEVTFWAIWIALCNHRSNASMSKGKVVIIGDNK